MTPLDRNQKRITTIQNQVKAGKLSQAEGDRLIAKIKASPPKIYARYKDPHGRDKYEKAKTWEDAEAIEAQRSKEIQVGEYTPQDLLKTPFVQVLEYYFKNRMIRATGPRAGAKSARAHIDHAARMLGRKLTLGQIDKDPDLLAWHFRLTEEVKPAYKFFKRVEFATPGTTQNYFITLSAATKYFLRKKRIRMLNPFDSLDRPWKKGVRKQVISWTLHCKLVRTAATGRYEGDPFPAWLPAYMESGWETGWRAGEIQDWHWERMTLEPADPDDFPYILTLEEKQGEGEPVYTEKPITPRLASILKALGAPQKERGRVWPLGRSQTDKYVQRCFAAAGADDFTFHDYRRSFKRRIQEAALPIPEKLAMDYTGHKTRETHDRYTVNMRKELESVLKRLGTNVGQNEVEG